MDITYDPNKNAANIARHGLSLAEGVGTFSDPYAIRFEDVYADGEQRLINIGYGAIESLLFVVYTYRGQTVRLISVRRATRTEKKRYDQENRR